MLDILKYLDIPILDPITNMSSYEKLYQDFDGEKISNNIFHTRRQAVQMFSWAIPNKKAIDTLLFYSPLVEIGAGLGYWAKLVQDRGGHIVCYDKAPINSGLKNKWFDSNIAEPDTLEIIKKRKPFTQVIRGDAHFSALDPDYTLFLCWPPYDDPMAFEALQRYEGNYLIFVGESMGGCTGDDDFFNMLYKEWEVIEHIDIPQWACINDYLIIYKRKEKKI